MRGPFLADHLNKVADAKRNFRFALDGVAAGVSLTFVRRQDGTLSADLLLQGAAGEYSPLPEALPLLSALLRSFSAPSGDWEGDLFD